VRKFVTRQEDLHHVSQIRFINPEALAKPPGYTHVVEATTLHASSISRASSGLIAMAS
jgi:hypothetical protein